MWQLCVSFLLGDNEEKLDQQEIVEEKEELEETANSSTTSEGSSVINMEPGKAPIAFASPPVEMQDAPGAQGEGDDDIDRHGVRGQCMDDVPRNPEADNDQDIGACGSAVASNQQGSQHGPNNRQDAQRPMGAVENAPEPGRQPSRKGPKQRQIQGSTNLSTIKGSLQNSTS